MRSTINGGLQNATLLRCASLASALLPRELPPTCDGALFASPTHNASAKACGAPSQPQGGAAYMY